MYKKRVRSVRILGLFVLLLVVPFMSMICEQAEARKTWKVRMATYFGSDHAAGAALREVFVPMVKERTNGRVQVTVFDSCQLGAEVEFREGVRAGIIEMAIFGSMLENTLPKLKILQQPFVFRGVDHLLKVLNGPLCEELLSDFATIGVEPVSGFSQAEVHLGNNVRPIFFSKGHPVLAESLLMRR
jgi:TRAP-type C4-dicarboxylate transport system substrate-binding protein